MTWHQPRGYLYCWHFIQKTLQEAAQSDRCASAKDLLRDPENKGQKCECEHYKAEISYNGNICQRAQKILIIFKAADSSLH